MTGDEQPTLSDPRWAAASAGLGREADRRWVEVADEVLQAALAASRPSLPVRGEAEEGPFRLSEAALTTLLAHALEGNVPSCVVTRIIVHVSGADIFTGITLVLAAQFGTPLLQAADRARAIARDCLTDLLGPVIPPVEVSAMHVHFNDVLTEDTTLDLEPGGGSGPG